MNCHVVIRTHILIYSIITLSKLVNSDVKCGSHRAENCRQCVHGFDNPFLRQYLWYAWCNEDCVWDPVTKLCNGMGDIFQMNTDPATETVLQGDLKASSQISTTLATTTTEHVLMDDAPEENISTIDDSIATSTVAIFSSSPDLEKIDEELNQISTTFPASDSTTAYTSVTEKLLEKTSPSTPATETPTILEPTTAEKPFKSLSSLLPKTNPEEDPCSSGTEEEIADCCTIEYPCSFGQGDCDYDAECIGELICGKNNCGVEIPWNEADCCTLQPEEILKKNSDVDIAFMLDATSSMELNLEAVEKNIEEVVMRVKDTFFNIKVRVALVAYRDYSEAALHFEIMDFTEDVTEFINFITKVKAFYGGDIPEDVLGAIDKTINLDWKAANKLFFQIGDAPPRGYCDGFPWCTPPNERDKEGPEIVGIFKRLAEDCLEYVVLQISTFQDIMVSEFRAIAHDFGGDAVFRVFDMKGSLNFDTVAKAIIGSINEHIEKIIDVMSNPRGNADSCIVL